MATKALVKHGSEAGYRAELEKGDVCERCRNGHRQFDKQYTKRGRAQGLKYTRYDVVDHLYKPGKASTNSVPPRARPEPTGSESPGARPDSDPTGYPEQGPTEPEQDSQSPTGPNMRERMSALLGKVKDAGNPYVESDEYPDYLHTITPDTDPPEGDWAEVKPDEFVVTKQNMIRIEDNLGTYLSVVSMTLSLVDPYCAPNDTEIDDMVKRWSRVIGRYPRAAKLFMSEGGGALMDWLGAATATWPILIRLYEHHLSHEVKVHEGQVYRVQPSANGHPVDATMPPQDSYNYTVN